MTKVHQKTINASQETVTSSKKEIPHIKETKKAHHYTKKTIASAAKTSEIPLDSTLEGRHKRYDRLMAGLSPNDKRLIWDQVGPALEQQNKAKLRRIRNKPQVKGAKKNNLQQRPQPYASPTPKFSSKTIASKKPEAIARTDSPDSTVDMTDSLRSTSTLEGGKENHLSISNRVNQLIRPIFNGIKTLWRGSQAFRHTPKVIPMGEEYDL